MKLDFNIFSVLDIAAVIHGVVLGTVLLISSKKKQKNTFFLGILIIILGIERIPVILSELNTFQYYPELFRLPLNFWWLLYPLFYVYTQQVSIFANQKTHYWLLYPGIIVFLLQLIFFFFPYQTKLAITQIVWFKIFLVSGLFFGWVIAVWNIKLLIKHKVEVNNYFSLAEHKELQWAKTFLIVSIIGSILYIYQFYLVPKNVFSRVFFIVFDLLTIYWVSYHGIHQHNVYAVLSNLKIYNSSNEKKTVPNKTPETDHKNLEELMNQIDAYMINSKSYRQSELTIMALNEQLKVHPKRISLAINTIHGQNFNSYVNQLRIKKAKKLLETKESKNLSVEGIGNEVGFHSKSAFYSAFKKITGTTPNRYKLQHTS